MLIEPSLTGTPGSTVREPAPPSVVIGAGGTGGHIYPGLALAESIRQREPRARITFVGTERGLETRLIPEAGFPLRTVDMIPFARSVGVRRYLLPAVLARAATHARGILHETGAQVAVGMGGYSSAPLIAGARLARAPSLIHDSNAVPGRANVFSARFTHNVALAFGSAAEYFPRPRECHEIGMPITAALADFDRATLRPSARALYGVAGGTRLVLVNGGSQGSTSLNEAAVWLAARWRDRDDVRFVIKAGPEGVEEIARRLGECGGDRVATAVSYIDRMDLAYAAADVTICRAGAATIAELTLVGLPAVLVPYPHAPHDHQTRNAVTLVDRGAAVLVPDQRTDRIGPELDGLFSDPFRLRHMATAAAGAARPSAADDLARWALELAGHNTRRNA